jgi:hypothetical protein
LRRFVQFEIKGYRFFAGPNQFQLKPLNVADRTSVPVAFPATLGIGRAAY